MELECNVCSSPMAFRDNMWQCDNCFNVIIAADLPNDILIDEGVMLDDVLERPEGS